MLSSTDGKPLPTDSWKCGEPGCTSFFSRPHGLTRHRKIHEQNKEAVIAEPSWTSADVANNTTEGTVSKSIAVSHSQNGVSSASHETVHQNHAQEPPSSSSYKQRSPNHHTDPSACTTSASDVSSRFDSSVEPSQHTIAPPTMHRDQGSKKRKRSQQVCIGCKSSHKKCNVDEKLPCSACKKKHADCKLSRPVQESDEPLQKLYEPSQELYEPSQELYELLQELREQMSKMDERVLQTDKRVSKMEEYFNALLIARRKQVAAQDARSESKLHP